MDRGFFAQCTPVYADVNWLHTGEASSAGVHKPQSLPADQVTVTSAGCYCSSYSVNSYYIF